MKALKTAPVRARSLADQRTASRKRSELVRFRTERLGETLKQARIAKNLSVEALAQLADVGSGSISEIERGRGNPSYATLMKIAAGLELSVLQLFQGAEHDRSEVVRTAERPTLQLERNGNGFWLLTADSSKELRIVLGRFPKRFNTETPSTQSTGEAAVHVLKGRLEVTVGSRTHTLDAGDTITFDGRLPHSYRNTGAVASEALLIGRKQ